MSEIMFSVLVVCLNPGERIKGTLDSILQQTEEDYEIVIKDGGSSDGFLQWVPENHPRIRVVEQKDTGIYDAMNQAITLAKGKYLTFLNCGDSFHDAFVLENTKKKITENPGKAIYYGDTYCEKTGTMNDSPKEITSFTCFRNIPCHQACFYGRETFSKRKYNPVYRIRADYEHFLWCCLSQKMDAFYMGFTVADYEGGGYSESKKNKKRNYAEHREITAMYIPKGKLFLYRLYLVVTLVHLRRALYDSPRFSKWYQKITGGLKR